MGASRLYSKTLYIDLTQWLSRVMDERDVADSICPASLCQNILTYALHWIL